MSQFLSLFETVPETEGHNQEDFDELRNYGDVVIDDDEFFVISPRTHADSVRLGKNTRSQFCVADPNSTRDYDMIEMTGGRFFYVFKKGMSFKRNKRAILGVLIPPDLMAGQFLQAPTEMLVQHGRERLRAATGIDMNYSDEFLVDWINQLKEYGSFFEAYNSNNRIITPSELFPFLGLPRFEQMKALVNGTPDMSGLRDMAREFGYDDEELPDEEEWI